jgi:hypothetical protein
MRTALFCAGILAVLTCGCRPSTPTAVPGEPLTGAENNVLGGSLSDTNGGFSYRMPIGWSATTVPELKFQLAQEPMFPGYRSNIRVTRERVPMRFDLYLRDGRNALLELLEDAKVVEDSDFTTVSGLRGKRWRVHAKTGSAEVLQLFYLFPGPGDDKIVMTASCTLYQASRMVFVFDAAAKTLELR